MKKIIQVTISMLALGVLSSTLLASENAADLVELILLTVENINKN